MGVWDWLKSEGGNLVNTADLGAYNPATGSGWANGGGFSLSNYLRGGASGLSGGLVGGSSANPSGFLGSGKSLDGAGSGGLANTLEGDPQGMSAALQKLMGQAYDQSNATKNFLLGREGVAEQYYQPMQRMFGQMYGTGGMMPPRAPGFPGGK